MPDDSPIDVTETFITHVADGEFDEAEAVVHSDGPFEGTGELLAFVSLAFTDFLLQFLLMGLPTEIETVSVLERKSATAETYAEVAVSSLHTIETNVELRTERRGNSKNETTGEKWRIWDVEVEV